MREQLAVWDRIEAAGGRIVAAQEDLDTSTPNGRFIRTLMLANAERELEEHAERFENLRRWATTAGIWQRRQTPRGYARDPGSRKLVPDEHAESVRHAFRQRAGGESVSQVGRGLGMTPSGARALLRNRVYLGELRVGQHTNPTAHPALITEDEWFAVQARRGPVRPPRSDNPVALLAGLVRCASCGHIMRRGSTGQGNGVYACHRDHSAGPCPQPTAITIATLDEHVEAGEVLGGAALTWLATVIVFAIAGGDRARPRIKIGPGAATAAILFLLALAPMALAHDPGQGDDAGSVGLRVAVDEGRARVTAQMARETCAATPVAVVARRGGQTVRGPLTKRGCQLQGALALPERGRWFVYVEMRRRGRALESWLPVTVRDGRGAVADRNRYAYFPPKVSSDPVKFVAGVILYGVMLALLYATFVLLRASRRQRNPSEHASTASGVAAQL